MAYKTKDLELEQAYLSETISGYSYALLYMISSIRFCKTEELGEVDWSECLEARFFCADKELHIFENEEGWKAVEISDDGNEDICIRKYQLDKKYKNLGKILCVQEYLGYDEDGQMYVALTRLQSVE